MAENTKIEWATHSFSPWVGCARVHAGCQHCYAEAMAGRLGVTWGPNGTRRRTAESTWRKVEKWNREAECNCEADDDDHHWYACPQYDRPRVFPSLCDPFEDWGGPILNQDCQVLYNPSKCRFPAEPATSPPLTMADLRRDSYALIDRCQNLDFLLLTKRPENILRMWPHVAGAEYIPEAGELNDYQLNRRENCWLLASASDQNTLDSVMPHLLDCRSIVPVIGLSLEPLVGPVDLPLCFHSSDDPNQHDHSKCAPIPDWIIVGGESGPKARPMRMEWLESIADQCQAAGVPLFVKQDAGPKPGQQGRIPDRLWSVKQFPGAVA